MLCFPACTLLDVWLRRVAVNAAASLSATHGFTRHAHEPTHSYVAQQESLGAAESRCPPNLLAIPLAGDTDIITGKW